MNNPSYTIAIPVYTRILGFQEALQSALSVEGCTEVLVIDDNSPHNQFEEICNSFKDIRVKYSKNFENKGIFGNWNRGVELATSDFISILCSDDFIEPDAFKLFLLAYSKDNKIDVFFGSHTVFYESKEDAEILREFKEGKMNGIDLFRDAIMNAPGFPVLTIARTETMRKYPFVSKPHSGNDWLWIYSNAMSLNLYATNRTISYWRNHPDQDAMKSISVTMDCWPMMYMNMSEQLSENNKYLSTLARRRAKGLVLSWLINEYNGNRIMQKRLLNAATENNLFIDEIIKLIERDWLLSRLINSKGSSHFIYNMARFLRKTGLYPG